MIGNYGQRGWDLPEDEGGGGDGGGGGKYTPEERLYRFRFKMESAEKNEIHKGAPVVHRILFLNDAPFSYWEHNLWSWRGCGHWTAICLAKDKIDDRGCPICLSGAKGNWPYYIGLFGIIDFGQIQYQDKEVKLTHNYWKNSDGEKVENPFPRILLPAKLGSADSPGVLKKLMWQAERKGGTLEGTVWDTSRSGKKEAQCGETWEYVDRVAPEDYVDYLAGYGADRGELNVDPIDDWKEICKPLSYEAMARIVGGGESKQQGKGKARSDGADYEGGQESGSSGDGDDDIPF